MEWYIKVLKNFVNFKGRARRKEYWMFYLFNFIVAIALTLVDTFILGSETGTGFLSSIYSLAVILPTVAVSIRRLHDIDKSGWWLLIAFIPLIGAIILLVWSVKDSQVGDNQYGENPKGIMA